MLNRTRMKHFVRVAALLAPVIPVFTQIIAAQSASPVRWKGEIELKIGGAEANDDESFGRISGLAVDRGGRIYVADAQDNQLRVFSRTGPFIARIGRMGSGPVEFKRLSTIAIGPDQLLWTRDEGNARLLGIDVSATPARGVRNVPLKQFMGGSRVPLIFEPDGSLVDESIWFDKSIDSFRPIRLRRTLTGDIARSDTIPVPDGAMSGVYKITQVQKDAAGNQVGISQRYLAQPHGPQWLRAYGPAGVRADVVTSRYEVRVIDRNGALLRTIRRTVPPVPLSARERRQADSIISNAGAKLPFGVPASKAPIVAVMWTQGGQLWVERAVEDGRPREADVFDTAGKLIATAEWPRSIDLATGFAFIDDRTVIAVAADADDVQRIVRLRFR